MQIRCIAMYLIKIHFYEGERHNYLQLRLSLSLWNVILKSWFRYQMGQTNFTCLKISDGQKEMRKVRQQERLRNEGTEKKSSRVEKVLAGGQIENTFGHESQCKTSTMMMDSRHSDMSPQSLLSEDLLIPRLAVFVSRHLSALSAIISAEESYLDQSHTYHKRSMWEHKSDHLNICLNLGWFWGAILILEFGWEVGHRCYYKSITFWPLSTPALLLPEVWIPSFPSYKLSTNYSPS